MTMIKCAKNLHLMTEENTGQILKRGVHQGGKEYCKECKRETTRVYQRKWFKNRKTQYKSDFKISDSALVAAGNWKIPKIPSPSN